MDSHIWGLLLVQIILIALNAVFASAEIAVLSVNETKMEKMAEQGDKRAKRLFKLTREPARFLSTIQIAITLSGFLGSAFAADGFSEPLVGLAMKAGIPIPEKTLDTIAVIVITLILSYFTLIFGELVPKRIAMKKAEELSLAISGLISTISKLFKPIVSLLSISTNAVLRLCGIDPSEEDEKVGEEEIRMMVEAGGEHGTIDKEEQTFIQNVFEFDDMDAEEISTHRTDVTILWLEDDDSEWKKTIYENRHTRYPVCDGSPDQVVGILNTKDYFRLRDKSRDNVLAEAVSPAYFVPKTIKADVLFRNMKKEHQSIAVVLDEYGGMIGIVTLNDLIEELVGDLGDEPDGAHASEPHIRRLDETSWEVVGNVELEDITEATGVPFDNTEHGTLTGIMFDTLGKVPPDGRQEIELDVEGLHIHVYFIKEHQIERATVQLLPKPQEEAEE